MNRILQIGFTGALLFALWAVCPCYARLMVHPALVDAPRELFPKATVIVRGQVTSVAVEAGVPYRFTAGLEVDRWYRGTPKTAVSFTFQYSDRVPVVNGHNCTKFESGSWWILFATVAPDGKLQLVDDCYGALEISSRLGRAVASASEAAQMEADFEAGLDDPDPAARLFSIQRLANLRLTAARPALRLALENASDTERPWIVFASIRNGDVSFLKEAAEILKTSTPPGWSVVNLIGLSLRELNDRAAVPGLIEILQTSQNFLAQNSALQVLGDKVRDPRAVEASAALLGNAESSLSFNALVGVWNITHAPACSMEHWTEENLPEIKRSCRAWWESEGHLQHW